MYRTIQLFLVVLILISLYIIWLLYRPYPMVNIESPVPIHEYQDGYNRGDDLVFQLTYTKQRNYPGSDINRRIECEDGNLVTMTSFNSNLPISDEPKTVLSPAMTIPDKVSDGWCWFVFTEEVPVNHFRMEENEDYSQSFYVLPLEDIN